ncbi:hypothetical protein M3A49_22530 [Paraburkholderia sp. CNPSo 3076]|uniref:hypothetical protein n=1 Tax=Paraburkholderia sp. CNPSo 3076 TaxID=2940936 RepID=UPI00224C7FA8|nr:hypothetical protein [Paraburkholderia sp. CNPSo 3076]MCX5542239.1 hypothetical protein [Paraburkholderia sp. CNPSo 3076]
MTYFGPAVGHDTAARFIREDRRVVVHGLFLPFAQRGPHVGARDLLFPGEKAVRAGNAGHGLVAGNQAQNRIAREVHVRIEKEEMAELAMAQKIIRKEIARADDVRRGRVDVLVADAAFLERLHEAREGHGEVEMHGVVVCGQRDQDVGRRVRRGGGGGGITWGHDRTAWSRCKIFLILDGGLCSNTRRSL